MNTREKDLIIIGAGMNGLSAGLAYALENPDRPDVLIIEKNAISGGYVTSFKRHGYRFDTCQMMSNVSDILDYFGIEMEFHNFQENCIRLFLADPPTGTLRTFDLCGGGEQFENCMLDLFPEDAAKLRKFFRYSLAMFREIYGLKYAPGFLDILKMLFTCPKVIRNKSKTLSAYLRMFGLNNPDIGLVFQAFSAMCGLPNHRIAALLGVGVMYSLREKAYRPQGPFLDLPQKMEQRYRELGGDLYLKREVANIIIEDGHARGVLLKDGTVIPCRHIISTVDINTTMRNLIGMDRLRTLDHDYAVRIDSVKMTTSSFTVNLGIDDSSILAERGLYCGYGLLTSGPDAFSKLFEAFEQDECGLTWDCFYIGFSCPPLQYDEPAVLQLQAIPMPVCNWVQLRETAPAAYTAGKERLADLIEDIVEQYLLPDLRQHVTVRDIATPATYARYSGSLTGSIYDMAAEPDNFGANRLPVFTPVKGLLVPKFAHGVFGAMNSGLQAVDILLNGRVMQGNSRFEKTTKLRP